LTQKNEAKKSQDCACFAQKTCARLTKSFKLAAAQLKHERFFTSILLVFWLTRQGRWRVQQPRNAEHGTTPNIRINAAFGRFWGTAMQINNFTFYSPSFF